MYGLWSSLKSEISLMEVLGNPSFYISHWTCLTATIMFAFYLNIALKTMP